MKKCALLSMDNLDAFECYDHLLIEPMAKVGWDVEEVSWRNPSIDWNSFDVVVVRSTWDYQDDSKVFLEVLNQIDKSTALLLNPLPLIKWNVNKRYLAELEEKGVTIVPTNWSSSYTKSDFTDALKKFAVNQLIIKPCVSANADDTFRLNSGQEINHELLEKRFRNRECMIQPFMRSVIQEGEYSLFYFNGKLSHTILKKPKTNDFRVQEEHGGQLTLVSAEKKLLNSAEKVLENLPFKTLYARLDFVRKDDEFALMEAELIEPSLYFNLDKDSPKRFTSAFLEYIAFNA